VTVARAVGAVLILMVAGLAVVAVRMDQVQLARRVAQLHGEQMVVERKLWEQELTIARLRAPQSVRERTEFMNLVAQPPHEPEPDEAAGRLAAR